MFILNIIFLQEQEVERKRQEATIREIREAEEMMKQQHKELLMEHYRVSHEPLILKCNLSI